MATIFSHDCNPDGLLVRLIEKKLLSSKAVPLDQWPRRLDKDCARRLRSLIETGDATPKGEELLLPHPLVATLPASFAERLGLPPLGGFSLTLQFEGRIETADGRIRARWSDANYRSTGVERIGAILRVGKDVGRLTESLFRLAEAVDRFNATAGADPEARVAAWTPIQELLTAATGQKIEADAYMRSLTFYQAGAFALDIVETEQGPDFTPILMSKDKIRSQEGDAPAQDIGSSNEGGDRNSELFDESADALLPAELQRQFIERNFKPGDRTRDAYVLGRNTYVVLDAPLKAALDVVRRQRRASAESRRAFLRNPRAVVASALAEAGLEGASLFVETTQYSDRVEGVGVWEDIRPEPRQSAMDWIPEGFGEDAPESPQEQDEESPSASSEDDADEENEEEAGSDAAAHIGLIIKNNVDTVEYAVERRPREPLVARDFPYHLLRANKPKQHQIEGFDWLIDAWTKGWPGVLLADDMGLGKTYQALAFLAWIRATLVARGTRYPTAPPLGPMLVVAPTALLQNWLNEARLHLAEDGLGDALEAFGTGLKRLKQPKGPDWREEDALDIERLRAAGWILTTYETLADHHRAFARVPYSVAVFDEMQKIKEPGSINARSSKTINADFVLGLTGTPVENRIEDIWAIFDRIAPGYLGALRDFSKYYGGEDERRLAELKGALDAPRDGVPAPMLRRMKDRARDGLPEKRVQTYETPMPKGQADAYSELLAKARQSRGARGRMLEVLHHMRGISLHPARAEVDTSDVASIQSWLAGSARLSRSIEILRRVEAKGEKALVFIEDLAVQKAYAEAIAAIFDLSAIPSIINGGVPGGMRQSIVDRFQKAPPGFSILVLSPKAAGVGLTITAANHVLHLSRWWNPAVEDQCNDRAYRIGATKDVTIHIPLALHPELGHASFDAKLHQLLERKRTLSRHMLCAPESGRDVEELFGGVASGA